MTWRIHHHWLANPCRHGSGWARDRLPGCPVAAGPDADVATAACDALTALVDRLGMTYDPVGGGGDWLWCLGGPDLIRDRRIAAELAQHIGCIDLHLEACTRHRSFTVFVDGHDLAADQPVELGDDDVVGALVRHVESWLDSILVLRDRIR